MRCVSIMIAIDTNVLVRLLTGDDERQFKAAQALFASEDIYIADSVVLETAWVLRHAYELPPETIVRGLRSAFGLPQVSVESAPAVARALAWHEAGMDFADALHLAKSEHVGQFKTFDRQLIKAARGRAACPVASP